MPKLQKIAHYSAMTLALMLVTVALGRQAYVFMKGDGVWELDTVDPAPSTQTTAVDQPAGLAMTKPVVAPNERKN